MAAVGAVFGGSVAEQVLVRVRESPQTTRRGAEAFPSPHRPRARGPHLVAAGLSNAAIAGRLQLSDKTVRNVVSTVLGKGGAGTPLTTTSTARSEPPGSGTCFGSGRLARRAG